MIQKIKAFFGVLLPYQKGKESDFHEKDVICCSECNKKILPGETFLIFDSSSGKTLEFDSIDLNYDKASACHCIDCCEDVEDLNAFLLPERVAEAI